MTPTEYQQERAKMELDRLIKMHPDKAQQVREKPARIGWFVGQVMKSLRGRGRPTPQWVLALAAEKLGH